MREAQTSTDGLLHMSERETQRALTQRAQVAQFTKLRLLDTWLIPSKESQYTLRGDSSEFSLGQLL